LSTLQTLDDTHVLDCFFDHLLRHCDILDLHDMARAHREKTQERVWTFLGMLTCLVWPAVVVAVSVTESRRST